MIRNKYLYFSFISILSIIGFKSSFYNNQNLLREDVSQNQKLSNKLFELNNFSVFNEENSLTAINSVGLQINQNFDGDKISSIKYGKSNDSSSFKLLSFKNDSDSYCIENQYSYDDSDNLTFLKNNNNKFYFNYDANDNFICGTLNGKKKYTNSYDSNDNLIKVLYPSGDYKKYDYLNEKISNIYYNNKEAFSYSYDDDFLYEYDHINSISTKYKYDNDNRILSFEQCDNSISGAYEYSDLNIKKSNFIYKNNIFNMNYIKNSSIFLENDYIRYFDKYERNSGYSLNGKTYNFEYKTSDIYDISPITFSYGNNSYNYIYDEIGNICKIYLNNILYVEYEYNWLNQLVLEYYPQFNLKMSYIYDMNGNIEKIYNSKKGISEFEIGDNNEILSINENKISYDENGNLLNYDGMKFSWNNGKELSKINKRNMDIQYTYNSEGIRTSKEINGNKTKYFIINNNVIFEYSNDNFIYYIYDSDFNLIGFYYNDNCYYYIKNHQNDIVGIVDKNNNIVASYTYDAYGNIVELVDYSNENIAYINPYRYRGYRYDTESNLYYLNTRYYSPVLGRFLSEDDIKVISNEISTYAHINLYSYAQNNPVKYVDPNGDSVLVIAGFAISTKALVLLGSAVILSIIIQFQSDSIAKILENSFSKFEDLIKVLVKSLPSLWDRITKSSKPEIHHIVAKAAAKAAPARNNCINKGIDVYNDDHNLVSIKSRFHRKLHTNLYYNMINIIVVPYSSRESIYNSMECIKLLLFVLNTVS